jgi:hypothetical protein
MVTLLMATVPQEASAKSELLAVSRQPHCYKDYSYQKKPYDCPRENPRHAAPRRWAHC